MPSRILLIGTFDTKGAEFSFVRNLIHDNGDETLLIDVGVLGESALKADIIPHTVAKEGGQFLEKLRRKENRNYALDVMTQGAKKIVSKLYNNNEFDGILSLGGGSGTALATSVMRELPIGVPKFMVSSVASGDVSPYMDIKDITMMYSVADIEGLNRFSRRILSNAAGAICGMAGQKLEQTDSKPLLAATMFGVTTPCVSAVRQKLESMGYELVVFHATGTGGRAMEAMITDGFIDGVADITTTEWCDEVVGGVLSAGPSRLEAAGKSGIPQVVSCGALDMVNFHAISSVPEKYQERTLHTHTPQVTLMRTTPEECKEIGRRIAEKLNNAKGPTVLMLPLKGVSMIDKEGAPFYDPEANIALFSSLREHIDSHVKIREMDFHINDPEFADAIAQELLTILN